MKKISVLVLILIIFNFIFLNCMVYAEPDSEDGEENVESSEESNSTSLSMEEYKSIADEGKTTISGNQKKISLSESDVGSASSNMATFLSTVAASILKITSKFTYENGFQNTDSDYSAEKVGFFTINSLIFDEYILFNAKIYEKSIDTIEGDTTSPILTVIDTLKQKGSQLSSLAIKIAIALSVPFLMLSIVKYVSSKKADDLAAWKKILIRWGLCIVLITIYPYILTTLDVLVDSFINSAMNVRISMENAGNISFETTIIEKIINQMADTGGVTSLAYSFIFVALVVIQVLFIAKYVIRLFGMVLLYVFAPIIIIIHSVNLMLGKDSNVLGNMFKTYIVLDFLPVIHTIVYLIFFFSLSEIAISVPVIGICVLIAMYRAIDIIKAMFELETGTSIFSI